MSDKKEKEGRKELEKAIEENPEEVAKFIERIGLINEFLDTTALAKSALDDEMVKELTKNSEFLMESIDGLSSPETTRLSEEIGQNAEELNKILKKIVYLEKNGSLDNLIEIADTVSLLTEAMDDEMVKSLSKLESSLGELANTTSDTDITKSLKIILESIGETNEIEKPPEKIGMFGLLKALRDPKVQRGLGFLILITKLIGKNIEKTENKTNKQ